MRVRMKVPERGLGIAQIQVIPYAGVLRVIRGEQTVLEADLEAGGTAVVTTHVEIHRFIRRDSAAETLKPREALSAQCGHGRWATSVGRTSLRDRNRRGDGISINRIALAGIHDRAVRPGSHDFAFLSRAGVQRQQCVVTLDVYSLQAYGSLRYNGTPFKTHEIVHWDAGLCGTCVPIGDAANRLATLVAPLQNNGVRCGPVQSIGRVIEYHRPYQDSFTCASVVAIQRISHARPGRRVAGDEYAQCEGGQANRARPVFGCNHGLGSKM